MLLIKKNRYKPFYKSFIKLRENVQNKTKIFKFKKKKWERFLNYVKKRTKRYKKYKPKDLNIYLVSKYPIRNLSYKKRFKNTLIAAKRFSFFYGGIPKKLLKKSITSRDLINNNSKILQNFERRLDVILLRSKFCISMRNSRQLISHGKVYINKKIVKNKSFILKKGDFITINPKMHKLVENNLVINFINNHLWPIPPRYLSINYKTMEIIFGNIENNNILISTNVNFNLDIEKISQNYKQY